MESICIGYGEGNILVSNRRRLLSIDAGWNVIKIWEDFVSDKLGEVVEVVKSDYMCRACFDNFERYGTVVENSICNIKLGHSVPVAFPAALSEQLLLSL
jgi:hypothetical protein